MNFLGVTLALIFHFAKKNGCMFSCYFIYTDYTRYALIDLMMQIYRYAIDTMQSVCIMESGTKTISAADEEKTVIGQTFGGYFRSKVQNFSQALCYLSCTLTYLIYLH